MNATHSGMNGFSQKNIAKLLIALVTKLTFPLCLIIATENHAPFHVFTGIFIVWALNLAGEQSAKEICSAFALRLSGKK